MKIKADPNIDIIGIAGNIYLINLTSKLPVIKKYGSTHERKSMAIVLAFWRKGMVSSRDKTHIAEEVAINSALLLDTKIIAG